MAARTLPIAASALRSQWKATALAVVLAFALGVMPTVKSAFEAAIINQIDEALREGATSFSEQLDEQIQDLNLSDVPILGDIFERFVGLELASALGLYALVLLIAWALGLLASASRSTITMSVFSAIRSRALRNALFIPPHDDVGQTNSAAQLSEDLRTGAQTIANNWGGVPRLAQDLWSLATALVVVVALSPRVAVVLLAGIIAQIAITSLQSLKLSAFWRRYGDERRKIVGATDDILTNRDLVVAWEQTGRYERKLGLMAEDLSQLDRRIELKHSFFRGLGDLTNDVFRIGILVAAFGAIVTDPGAPAGVADAYLMLSLFSRIQLPTINVLRWGQSIRQSTMSSTRLLEVLALPRQAVEDPPDVAGDRASFGQSYQDMLCFQSVRFQYARADRPILQEVSFRVPTGSTTLLVGRSGSGKSTIVRIAMGLARPTAGVATLGGRRMFDSDMSLTTVLSMISFVPQARHVVDASVEDNLFLRGHERNDGEVERVLHEVGLDRDDSIDELLTKPAAALSFGMQQRLAVARLLLDDAPFVILDEPLAGIDVFTFSELQPPLKMFLEDPRRTVLIVSHRLAFASMVNHVVVLSDGRVDEEGSPEELRANADGQFSRIERAALNELAPSASRARLIGSSSLDRSSKS